MGSDDAGQTIQYTGTASDPEDGALDCPQFGWQVVFHHDEHTHPFIGPLEGDCSGAFVVPVLGEPSPNTRYAIHLRATDSGAPLGAEATLEGHQVIEVFPNKSRMTLETTPLPDLQLALDTTPFEAPREVEGVVGFVRRIGAPDTQTKDGRNWTWLGWSDGGERSHDVATPATDTTHTASFGCDVQVEVEALRLEPTSTGRLRLSWDAVDDHLVG